MAYDLQLFANNAVSLLAAPISASATSLTVLTGHGSLFPQPTGDGSDYFLVTLENETATTREIIRVNGRSGDTFTGLLRGQEGTTAVAWSAGPGSDTLVDQRITAETMRLAMLLPQSGSGGAGTIEVEESGVSVGPADTLNFTGVGVAVTGTGSTKTITITHPEDTVPGSSVTAPVNIPSGNIETADVGTYSTQRRGFKFFVTLYAPSNHRSATFEVLGNIRGDITAGTESATWNVTARVGDRFAGSASIVVNTITKNIRLEWQNDEPFPVEVMTTRIEHHS